MHRRRRFRHDPEGLRLPVKLDTATNGEFAPIPLGAVHRLANETALREATRHARGLGMSRREFMVSAAGTATDVARDERGLRRRRQCRRGLRARPAGGEGSRARAGAARRRRVHLRRAGPLRGPRRAMAQGRAAARRRVPRHAGSDARRRGPDRAPGRPAVRPGRVPRFRHRLHGAVVRAEHLRRRAADDLRGERLRAHRRASSKARGGC